MITLWKWNAKFLELVRDLLASPYVLLANKESVQVRIDSTGKSGHAKKIE